MRLESMICHGDRDWKSLAYRLECKQEGSPGEEEKVDIYRMEEETEDQIYKEQQERQEAKQETLLLWKVMENCIS